MRITLEEKREERKIGAGEERKEKKWKREREKSIKVWQRERKKNENGERALLFFSVGCL